MRALLAFPVMLGTSAVPLMLMTPEASWTSEARWLGAVFVLLVGSLTAVDLILWKEKK